MSYTDLDFQEISGKAETIICITTSLKKTLHGMIYMRNVEFLECMILMGEM